MGNEPVPKENKFPGCGGLCIRCEHRAVHFETGHGPRYECGEHEKSKYSCYSYRPVNPCILEPDKGEKRPVLAGYLFAGRSHAVGTMDITPTWVNYQELCALDQAKKKQSRRTKAHKKNGSTVK